MPNSLYWSVRSKSSSRDETNADQTVDQFNKWSKTLTGRCSYRHCFEFAVKVKVRNYFHNFNNYILILTCSNVVRSLSVNKFYQELAYLYSRLIMLQLSVVTYTQYTSDKDRKTLQKYQHGVSTIKNTFAYIPPDTAGKTCDHIL